MDLFRCVPESAFAPGAAAGGFIDCAQVPLQVMAAAVEPPRTPLASSLGPVPQGPAWASAACPSGNSSPPYPQLAPPPQPYAPLPLPLPLLAPLPLPAHQLVAPAPAPFLHQPLPAPAPLIAIWEAAAEPTPLNWVHFFSSRAPRSGCIDLSLSLLLERSFSRNFPVPPLSPESPLPREV